MNNQAEAIQQFISERVRAAEAKRGKSQTGDLPPDFNLLESGAFDSLAFVELIAAIEEEFSLEVDFNEVDPESFTTISGLVEASLGGAPSES